MMHNRVSLSSINLWEHHQELCLSMLREALQELANGDELAHEDDLNRELYFAINRVSHRLSQQGIYVPSVIYEGRNPPVRVHSTRTAREYKRPDFYWAYTDPYAADPNDTFRHFVVECKRLTEPLSAYSKEYVDSGITRFITLNHSYAWGVKSGAMVGYLQGVLIDETLTKTNDAAASSSVPSLSEKSRNDEAFAEFENNLHRLFPESPFRLIHIWARVGSTPSP